MRTTIRIGMVVPLEASVPLWNKRLFLVANADVVARQVYPESRRIGRWSFTAIEETAVCGVSIPHQHFAAEALGDEGYLGSTEVRSDAIKAVLAAPPGRVLRLRIWLCDRLVEWFGGRPHSWPLAWLGIQATYSDGGARVLCPDCEEWIPTYSHRH